MMSEDGRITKALLKTRSGEFDLESIHSLVLRELGISDLGCIGECSTLERLDLYHNDISRLTKLAGLTNIYYLNLSANRISNIEGLQTLDNLQQLNLAGNLIGSVDSLRYLTGLEHLRELRLQDQVRGLSNPICMNHNYMLDMKSMFQNLTVLDGERLKGRGSEVFQLCREIDDALSVSTKHISTETPQAVPWVPEGYWEPSNKFEQSNLHDAKEQLEGLLASCKRLNQKAVESLSALENS